MVAFFMRINLSVLYLHFNLIINPKKRNMKKTLFACLLLITRFAMVSSASYAERQKDSDQVTTLHSTDALAVQSNVIALEYVCAENPTVESPFQFSQPYIISREVYAEPTEVPPLYRNSRQTSTKLKISKESKGYSSGQRNLLSSHQRC